MPSRLVIALKFLHQMGPGPLALNVLYRIGVKTGHYQRTENGGLEIRGEEIRKLFKLPGREDLREVLGMEGERELLSQADEIVAGKVRLFGGEPVLLQLTFDQRLQHWSAYEINPRLLSSFLLPHDDIKYAWEPARFGWAFTLGRAYHLTTDERYAEAFWKHFEQFTAANPPYLGPHWMNGQEAALRLMALVWAAQVFEPASASSPERRLSLLKAIAQHASRIPPTLVYARSQNNNHLVTEAAGLYTAGLALGNRRWRDLGWHWLNRSFQSQIGGYGEYIQHSANYHRLMLQVALWADAIKDTTWSQRTSRSLARASHFLFSILDPAAGRVPNLGANDGAMILPLSATTFDDFRPTVQAAARAFLKTQISPGVWDELSLWLGLKPVPKTYEPGHYLSDNLRGKDSWAYLRASRFKSRLGHMDQLNLDLWWRGLNLARDAGTYLYNGPAPWDNPLVATRVHNTVTVDGRDQMTRGGRFLTLDWFPAYSETLFDSDPDVLQRMRAWHKGYQGVRHERIVTVYSGDRWVVEDTLTPRGASAHVYRLHWLLPDWEVDIRKMENWQQRTEIGIKSPRGWITFAMDVKPPISSLPTSDPLLSIVRAGELVHGRRDVLPYEGWFSPTYGVKIPTLSVALEVQATKVVTFTTEIRFPD